MQKSPPSFLCLMEIQNLPCSGISFCNSNTSLCQHVSLSNKDFQLFDFTYKVSTIHDFFFVLLKGNCSSILTGSESCLIKEKIYNHLQWDSCIAKSCFVMKAFRIEFLMNFLKRGGGGQANNLKRNLCNNSLKPRLILGVSPFQANASTQPRLRSSGGKKTVASDKGTNNLECNTDAESSAKTQTTICFLKLRTFYFFPPPPPPVRTRDIPRTLSSLSASRQLPRMLGHCL